MERGCLGCTLPPPFRNTPHRQPPRGVPRAVPCHKRGACAREGGYILDLRSSFLLLGCTNNMEFPGGGHPSSRCMRTLQPPTDKPPPRVKTRVAAICHSVWCSGRGNGSYWWWGCGSVRERDSSEPQRALDKDKRICLDRGYRSRFGGSAGGGGEESSDETQGGVYMMRRPSVGEGTNGVLSLSKVV